MTSEPHCNEISESLKKSCVMWNLIRSLIVCLWWNLYSMAFKCIGFSWGNFFKIYRRLHHLYKLWLQIFAPVWTLWIWSAVCDIKNIQKWLKGTWADVLTLNLLNLRMKTYGSCVVLREAGVYFPAFVCHHGCCFCTANDVFLLAWCHVFIPKYRRFTVWLYGLV